MSFFFTAILVLFFSGIIGFFLHPQFGRLPKGERMDEIKSSPNYKNGQFQNLTPTPSFTGGANYFTVLRKFLFGKNKRNKPKAPLPSKKTNLFELDPAENILVWFGHSSYFLQLDGKNILVDPVFSGSASPLPYGTRAFEGTDRYTTEDLPQIDYLFLTHDHWDHLDFQTVKALKPKVKKVITGLGTGAHLERWGYDSKIVTERDWNEKIPLDEGFTAHTVPARHFSGRSFKRNQVLWTSFVLKTPTMSVFLGGDSGYDSHFSEIGKNFGPFDLVILENGQYNKFWKYIHMMPEEVLKAAKDLKAKQLFPVHNSKFSLSLHAWDEPLKTINRIRTEDDVPLFTPIIGQKTPLGAAKDFEKWWENQ